MAHLLLDGTTGNYASSPDSAVLDVSGDLDIIFNGEAVTWTRPDQADLVAKWTVGPFSPSFRFYQYPGEDRLIFAFFDSGGTQRTFPPSLPHGLTNERAQVRAFLDVDNGSGGSDVFYYYRLDSGQSWTSLGSRTVVTTTGVMQTGTALLSMGTRDESTTTFNGKVFRAQIWSGNSESGGTLVFDGDPSDTSTWDCPDKLFFTDKANSATVTLQGDATLVGDCPSSGNRMGGTGAIRKPPRY